jgi:transposase InsO family protein
MTALSLENQVEIVKSFFENRPMKIHWIQINSEIRIILAELLNKLELTEVAKCLNMNLETLSKLKSEKTEIDDIINIINKGDENNESKQETYYKIKKQVEQLHGFLPNRKLSKILNIPQSTIGQWFSALKSNRYNATVKKKNKTADNIKVISNPTKDVAVVSIDNTNELQELNRMLARHSSKSQKKYSKSEKDLILKLVDRFGSKLVHEQVKVSYDTIARLLRNRERGYVVPSTKAKFMPVIDTMKKFPGMGPMQIRDYNHRHFGVSMGVNTVRKVMEDNGWFPSYSRKVVITEEPRRYEAIRRNYMWHLDFKQFYINRCKVYLLFIEDDNSRFIVGHELADAERVDVVIETISKCITLHGKPETIMSDGGSAFYSWRGISKFTAFLEEFGIDQIVAKIPRVNGKVESINQKIEKELLLTQNFSSLNHLESELVEWIGLYNYRRPHQGLGNLQVPADKYYPGADKWFKGGDRDNNNHMLDALSVLLKEFKKSS